MKKALIFDFDGTLLDTERHNFRAWQETARRRGFSLELEFYQSLIGLTLDDSALRFQAHYGPQVPLEEWRSERRAIFYELWDQGQGPQLKPGLQVLLSELRERGNWEWAIASSSRSLELEHKLLRSQLQADFPVWVAGDQVPLGKPHPDVFLEAARRLGIPADHCLVVEDSPIGVEAARRAGMPVVFVPDMVPACENVRSYARAIVDDLAGVVPHL
jgi:HAD superfamily hydrolase (TIGR01509 family)